MNIRSYVKIIIRQDMLSVNGYFDYIVKERARHLTGSAALKDWPIRSPFRRNTIFKLNYLSLI